MRAVILAVLSLATIPTVVFARPRTTTVQQGARVRPPIASADQPACVTAADTDPASQLQTIDAIEQGFPEDFRKIGRIGKQRIDPDEMRSLVTMLACVGSWPAGQGRIARLATPLFASSHGREAFGELAAIATDRNSNAQVRAAARSFSAEMAFRVYRREPL